LGWGGVFLKEGKGGGAPTGLAGGGGGGVTCAVAFGGRAQGKGIWAPKWML